ncbi:ABC transporter permease [Arthrobacter crystallopoietes]|uniref:ABC transporter permease n=1 Tax=Crystallibacter crystallopoietes TaxID=37928 RepID=UPI003D1FF4B1
MSIQTRTGSAPNSLSLKLRNNWLPILIFAAVVIAVAVLVPSFFQPSNLLNVGRQSAIVGIIAVGMTFVILTGGIDLSVGSILALSGVTTAILINNGLIVPLAVVAGLLVGVAAGVINGVGVAVLKVQPFIMTLATMVAIQGLSLRLTDGGPKSFSNMNAFFDFIGSGNILGIPGPFLVFLVVAVAGILVLRYLAFGRYIYAIGGSMEAARLSGVRTTRTVILAYSISGLCAGLAGVMTAARLGVGDPTAGSLSNLDAITAVVIGGTSLMGGIGGAVGTVFGAILLAILSNVMNLLGISPFDQQIVKGAVIVIAVLIAARAGRRRFRERRSESSKSATTEPKAIPVPADK